MTDHVSLSNLLQHLQDAWSEPKVPKYCEAEGLDCTVRCELAFGGCLVDCPLIADNIPLGLFEFWKTVREASLFVDEYRHSGLHILGCLDAIKQTGLLMDDTPKNYQFGDLVIGEFLGDSEYLLARCDRSASDFGTIIAHAFMYPRDQWYFLNVDLTQFLTNFVAAEGEKYWEA